MADLPTTIPIDIDDWHCQLFDEEMDDEQREQIIEFVEGQLTDRATALCEEAIYKRYQQGK